MSAAATTDSTSGVWYSQSSIGHWMAGIVLDLDWCSLIGGCLSCVPLISLRGSALRLLIFAYALVSYAYHK